MRLFQAALDTCLGSPFFASLSVHGLHFTVYAHKEFRSPQDPPPYRNSLRTVAVEIKSILIPKKSIVEFEMTFFGK